ncbi:hypothetical protein H9P43_009506 [Blastocladiella emersonii ATCC 22665]|nr:hypothetical protein H9P43_009506 [Blastocladiella emersonii ATCC 22665]
MTALDVSTADRVVADTATTESRSGPAESFIAHTPDTLYARIHGKWYDLREFRDRHPGGPVAIGLVSGRDATVLFESYHPFASPTAMAATLKRYLVADADAARLRTIEEEAGLPPVDDLFDWPEGGSPFARDLKAAVRDYFDAEAKRRGVSFRQAMKGTPLRHVHLALLAATTIASIAFMVRGSVLAMFVTPLAAWITAANVFHDASHFALAKSPLVNWLASYGFPYFSSPTTWGLQHIIGHHAYPNLAYLDPDVAHTRHLRRDHPKFPWAEPHREQGKWYRMAPHIFLATTFGMNISNEVETAVADSYNDAVPVGPRTLLRNLVHFAGRALTITTMLGWPFLALPNESVGLRLAFALVPSFLFSFLFMVNTQVNHLTPDHIDAYSRDWFKHQVITAQNFGPGSAFHFWMSGGLNHQLEHHLFPGINHIHLRALQPRVLDICRKHGVKYTMASGYVEAVKNYMAHTFNMAVQPKDMVDAKLKAE